MSQPNIDRLLELAAADPALSAQIHRGEVESNIEYAERLSELSIAQGTPFSIQDFLDHTSDQTPE